MANIKDLIKSIEAADSSFDEKLAAINQMEETLVAMRQQEEQAVQDNVDLIVEAIKVMERKVESQLEIAKSIVPEKGDKGDKGDRGLDGANGRDGKDGRDGINGRDGQDGKDGVSVSDAKIDFDGSLIITLSTGQEINVGEVVAPELQEKIKLVTSGGAGTVLPDQTGNSGKVLGTNGSTLSWVTGGGGGGISSVASADGSVTVTTVSGAVDLSVAVAASTTNVICYVRNATGATLTKGTVVYITGATGQIPTVSKAIATSDSTSAQTLGVMSANLANNSNGYVTIIGLVKDIDTSAFTDGQQLYLSPITAGGLTSTKPYAPDHLVYVAIVEYAHPVHGELFVKVQNGYEMDELHNVSAQNATNGQVLIYNESTSLWQKNTLTDGTGITISEGAGTITVTNSAPDQTVALTGAGTTAITGTYPNFTVTSNDAYTGTVTSVGGTGTVNGLTLTGTVTSSGNLTLGGTLNLSSPPAIGGTTPAAISSTTLSLTGTTDQVSSVAVSSIPSAPSAGNLKTFARTIAGGYTAPAFLNATQAVAMLQPAIANKRISTFTPQTGAVISLIGFVAGNVQGTATAAAPSSTSFFTRAPRVTYVSAGTAGSFASWYQGVGTVTLGVSGTPNFGGFYYVTRFGIADTVASPRTFIGLTSVGTTPTNVEPSTLVNSIGVGQGASNTNLFVYYGGSAAQTPIDLGANFPTNTSNTDWYELTLFAPPSSTNTVYYQVLRLNTGNVASGTLTGTAGTVLPSNTTFLMPRNWRTNNATAAAVTLALGSMYLETDY